MVGWELFISVTPFSSYLSPCSSLGSFTWDRVLTELLQNSPSHSLQFFKNCSKSLLQGAVLQGRSCSSMGPLKNHKSSPKTYFSAGSSLQGLQYLPGACSSVSSPWGPSFIQGASTCPGMSSCRGCRATAASPWSPLWAAGQSLLCCLEAPPALPASLALVPSGLFLPFFLTPYLSLLHRIFYLLLHIIHRDNVTIQQCHWWTIWPVMDPLWSGWKPIFPDIRAGLAVFCHPCSFTSTPGHVNAVWILLSQQRRSDTLFRYESSELHASI